MNFFLENKKIENIMVKNVVYCIIEEMEKIIYGKDIKIKLVFCR